MSRAIANPSRPVFGRKPQNVLGRQPLGQSSRQNHTEVVKEVNLKTTGGQRNNTKEAVTKSKPIPKPETNDENAEVATEAGDRQKSRIPRNVKTKTNIKPKFVVTDMNAEDKAFSSNLIPDNVEDIDANDFNNVFLTPDYVKEIYSYLRQLESEQCLQQDFLAIQREMTPRMRSVLVDWLINVHHQFRLLPETLYLGISIMDRFFQSQVISKEKIQLVGVTAFFIASKFEEIYPPDIKDFVLICDKLYHKRDIIKMELTILRTLKFQLGRPLPLHFLRRNSKAAHADSRIHTLAKYLMELTLVEYECAHWKPSFLAAVALFVTLKLLAESESSHKWTPTLHYYSNYSEDQLLSGASILCRIIQKAEKSKHQNCRKKYSSTKLMEISAIPQLKSMVVDQMAAAVATAQP